LLDCQSELAEVIGWNECELADLSAGTRRGVRQRARRPM
jgi:hypothetical protein